MEDEKEQDICDEILHEMGKILLKQVPKLSLKESIDIMSTVYCVFLNRACPNKECVLKVLDGLKKVME